MKHTVNCPDCGTYLFTATGNTKLEGIICSNSKCKAKLNFDIKLAIEMMNTEPVRASKLKGEIK